MVKQFICILFLLTSQLFSQKIDSNKVNISGYILNDKTGEKLPGVLLRIDGKGLSISNEKGFFTFTLLPGLHTLDARSIGYEKLHRNILVAKGKEEQSLFLNLVPEPIEITGITVNGERFNKEINTSTYELFPGDLSRIPQVGEPDVFRALQALPGVGEVNDLSTQIFLRGGNFDEVLISIDNVPLYNPYHLGETFGIVNPDIIQLVRLYPSNYPSNYGGYLSGVLDLQTKNGNQNNFTGNVSLGLVSSKIFAEIPIWKGTLLISGRRTYLDLLGKIIKQEFPYYFYDLYSKYTLPLDTKNLVELSFLYSKDIYDIFKDNNYYQIINKYSDPNWGDLISNIKYSHFFSEKNEFSIQLYFSKSYLNADATAYFIPDYAKKDSINSLYINNSIKDLGIKASFEFNFTGNHFMTGLEIKKMNVNYDWDFNETDFSALVKFPLQEIFFDFAPNPYSFQDNSFIYNHYSLDKIQVNKKIEITPGYRLSYLSKIKKILFAPYILANYSFDKEINLRFSIGRYYQYLYTLKDQRHQELYAPFSSYLLANNINQVAFSYHFLIGLQINNLFNFLKMEIESYYKVRDNLSSSYNDEMKYYFENGYATGLDIIIKKDIGDLAGWLGYSFSRSVKQNNSYTYFTNYDRTHNIKLLLNYQLFEHWTLSSFWSFASGLPATPIIGKYLRASDYFNNNYFDPIRIDNDGRQWALIEGRKNSTKLSDFHRLDLGITGTFLWGSFILKPYLQVLNVLNSSNSYIYNARTIDTNQNEGEERGSFIIPTIGVSIDF